MRTIGLQKKNIDCSIILFLFLFQRLQMSNGSFLFNIWRAPPVEILLKIYIFNVTNPREFMAGKQKLKVEEVGPFVYR